MKYFKKKAHFRTICLECMTSIETFHAKVRKRIRERETRKLQEELGLFKNKSKKKKRGSQDDEDDDEDDIDSDKSDDSIGIQKRKDMINKISQRAKLVIKVFIQKGRENLAKRKAVYG